MENNMKITRTASKKVVLFAILLFSIIFGMCAYPIISSIVKSPSYVKVEAKIISTSSNYYKRGTAERFVSYAYSSTE